MNWNTFIKQEQNKDYYKKLTSFLEREYKSKTIYPKKEDILNAFTLTPFNDVKVVILGQDPYHNKGEAHGLSFSVLTQKTPPSLRNIYKELYNDIGVTRLTNDLTSWAEQGVFLLNTILTVEENKPLSHKNKGWEIFTLEVIKELNQKQDSIIFVLWGNNAISYEQYITNKHHFIIKSSHPSPLSARHSFFGSKVFSKINTHLMKTYNKTIDFE